MFTESKLSETAITSTQHGLAVMKELSRNQNRSFFSLRTRALKSGRTDTVVAATPSQWIWVKCYASGGENALHAHTHEDHTFIVLQGAALFRGPHGEEKCVTTNQGVTIPAGKAYSFEVTSRENLLMLRVGSPTGTGDPCDRTDAKGSPLDAFVEARTTLSKNMAVPQFDDFYHLKSRVP